MRRDSIIVVSDKKRDVERKRDEWITKMGQYGFFTEQDRINTERNVESFGKMCRQ